MLLSAPVSPALALSACCSHITYWGPASQQSVLSQGTWLNPLNFNTPPATPHFPLSFNSEDLSELRPELVEFCSQVIWGLIHLLISTMRRFSEGRGWLGFTFPIPHQALCPCLSSLSTCSWKGLSLGKHDETDEDHGEDPGFGLDGCGHGLHCRGACGR